MSTYTHTEKKSIYTKDFWRDAGERAISTFGQTAAAFLAAAIAAVLAGTAIFDFDWETAIFVVIAATLGSVLKALAAVSNNPETGASFGTTIPKGAVAAVEEGLTGQFVAEEAAPYAEGTPVEVIPDPDQHDHGYRI